MFDQLHEANFQLYAAKYYDNPHCFDMSEFVDDMNRFKYLKRLFNKYTESGELRERLILNHLVVIYNVWGSSSVGTEPATRMLFLRLQGYEQYLKPFLIYLSYLPEKVTGIGLENKSTNCSDIPMDQNIINVLRKI